MAGSKPATRSPANMKGTLANMKEKVHNATAKAELKIETATEKVSVYVRVFMLRVQLVSVGIDIVQLIVV